MSVARRVLIFVCPIAYPHAPLVELFFQRLAMRGESVGTAFSHERTDLRTISFWFKG